MVLNFFKSGYQKVKGALSKTSSLLSLRLNSLFSKKIDEETLEEIEQTLYEADLGVNTAIELTEKIRKANQKNPHYTSEDYIKIIHQYLIEVLGVSEACIKEAKENPTVILMVGVNGSGKTTSIAKLAYSLKQSGKKVLLGAADTFRAAATEQLTHWAEKLGCEIVKSTQGSDPAAVAYDAVTAAKARGSDVVIIDTAGRLQNKTQLMKELEKIKRTITKLIPDAPHETLITLDANTGQNGIDQAKQFHEIANLSGVILTKLDGSAKGGVVVATKKELNIPIKFIGVGESFEDLKLFNSEHFVNALLNER